MTKKSKTRQILDEKKRNQPIPNILPNYKEKRANVILSQHKEDLDACITDADLHAYLSSICTHQDIIDRVIWMVNAERWLEDKLDEEEDKLSD